MDYNDMTLTVKDMKEFLKGVLEKLDEYEDETKLRVVGNTFFMQNSVYYMQWGYKGFVSLDPIEQDESGDDWEDDEEE